MLRLAQSPETSFWMATTRISHLYEVTPLICRISNLLPGLVLHSNWLSVARNTERFGMRIQLKSCSALLVGHLHRDKTCLHRGQGSQSPDWSESWQSSQTSPSSAPDEEAIKGFGFVFSSIWICLCILVRLKMPEKNSCCTAHTSGLKKRTRKGWEEQYSVQKWQMDKKRRRRKKTGNIEQRPWEKNGTNLQQPINIKKWENNPSLE